MSLGSCPVRLWYACAPDAIASGDSARSISVVQSPEVRRLHPRPHQRRRRTAVRIADRPVRHESPVLAPMAGPTADRSAFVRASSGARSTGRDRTCSDSKSRDAVSRARVAACPQDFSRRCRSSDELRDGQAVNRRGFMHPDVQARAGANATWSVQTPRCPAAPMGSESKMMPPSRSVDSRIPVSMNPVSPRALGLLV